MPTAPMRPCVVCGVACDGGRCDKHQRSKSRQQYETTRRKDRQFYKRKRWESVRSAKLNRTPLCEDCWERGRVTPATEVHHVVERKVDPSRAYDLGNLQSLCKRCHARRSNAERREAMTET